MIFIKNREPISDPIFFPWFICVPIHAKKPVAWIRGLNHFGVNEKYNNFFCKYQIFDMLFA